MSEITFTSPLESTTVTSNYGYRNIGGGASTNHLGTDMDGEIGDPVGSAAGGVVIFSSYSDNPSEQVDGYGNVVVIRHYKEGDKEGEPTGTATVYAHLDSVNVSNGESVNAGQLLGGVGNTGTSVSSGGGDGSHLHFEWLSESSAAEVVKKGEGGAIYYHENGGMKARLGIKSDAERLDPIQELAEAGVTTNKINVTNETPESGVSDLDIAVDVAEGMYDPNAPIPVPRPEETSDIPVPVPKPQEITVEKNENSNVLYKIAAWVSGVVNKLAYAMNLKSPLVLDLDGGGVDLIHADDGVYFDIDNDNFIQLKMVARGDNHEKIIINIGVFGSWLCVSACGGGL